MQDSEIRSSLDEKASACHQEASRRAPWGAEAEQQASREPQPASQGIRDDLPSPLEVVQAKAEENWNLYLRAVAEMDTIQRRARLDVEQAQKFAIERFVKELIPVLDTFEKGLEAAKKSLVNGSNGTPIGAVEAMKEGMELTYKLLLDTLGKCGVCPIQPEGGAFDPSLHEALSAIPTAAFAPHHILEVVQKGYSLHGRLLRPARVVLSKAVENEPRNPHD